MHHVTLNVGHGPTVQGGHDPGAVCPHTPLTERALNERLARALRQRLPTLRVVDCPAWGAPLFAELNRQTPATGVVVSLHCNAAANPAATGTEVLYWATSARGRRYAEEAQRLLLRALQLPNRGLKPVANNPAIRGWALFAQVQPVVLLCEPFFLTSPTDRQRALDRFDALVDAYHELLLWLESDCQTLQNPTRSAA